MKIPMENRVQIIVGPVIKTEKEQVQDRIVAGLEGTIATAGLDAIRGENFTVLCQTIANGGFEGINLETIKKAELAIQRLKAGVEAKSKTKK